MIRIFKNKIISKENCKYTMLIVIVIIGIITVIIYDNIESKNNGLVINNNKLLENIQKDKIGVYIDGEVNKQGYIKIPTGSTLDYAINKAGGITKNADIQNINLDRVLKNQEKIIIPAIKEEIEEDDVKTTNDLININTASVEELTQLDGIGDKTAEKIIEFREENEFNSIEEIMEIKGIGEGKFDKIKAYICV